MYRINLEQIKSKLSQLDKKQKYMIAGGTLLLLVFIFLFTSGGNTATTSAAIAHYKTATYHTRTTAWFSISDESTIALPPYNPHGYYVITVVYDYDFTAVAKVKDGDYALLGITGATTYVRSGKVGSDVEPITKDYSWFVYDVGGKTITITGQTDEFLVKSYTVSVNRGQAVISWTDENYTVTITVYTNTFKSPALWVTFTTTTKTQSQTISNK